MNLPLIKIGLVDDHTIFRKTLIPYINELGNCKVILEAGNGRQLQQELNAIFPPDILLLDLQMPVMSGYETLDWLKEYYPEIKIIILSMIDFDFNIPRLLLAGARAFIKKDMELEELKKAIYSVNEKGFYYTDCTTRKLLSIFYNNSSAEFNASDFCLNEEELFFLKLSKTDMTYKEIADQMAISTRRIDKIRHKLFEKLHVKNRTSLAIKSISIGVE